MGKIDVEIVKVVGKEITGGYWDVDDAIEYTPMLFPYVNPEQKVRDAVKAMSCKEDKDERFRKSRSLLETERDYHFFIRELEHLMERESVRYKKEFPEEVGRRDYRDMLMMLIPALVSHKSNISISLDVNQLNQTIYGECEKCPIREICKEAFPIATEYVSFALKELGFEMPTTEK